MTWVQQATIGNNNTFYWRCWFADLTLADDDVSTHFTRALNHTQTHGLGHHGDQ